MPCGCDFGRDFAVLEGARVLYNAAHAAWVESVAELPERVALEVESCCLLVHDRRRLELDYV